MLRVRYGLGVRVKKTTFGAKSCFGATLHHFWSKSLFGNNTPSLLVEKLVWEQSSITFGAKACFGNNTASFLVQKLVWEQHSIALGATVFLEQHSITFGAKACFGATLHHFWSKSLFCSITFRAKACFGATLHHFCSKSLLRSNAPSLLVQKHVWEQHSITFGPKSLFGSNTQPLFKQKKMR